MDRRKFLTGVGTIGAAASAGTAALQTNGANARAAGLAKAARGGTTLRPPTVRPTIQGVTLAYLPGSSTLVEPSRGTSGARGSAPAALKWARWDASMAPAASAISRALRSENMVSITIGALERAAGPKVLKVFHSIEVVAHFAVADASFLPFYAWKHSAQSSSSPVTFDAYIPDRMALQVDYALDPTTVGIDVARTGMLYMPVGSVDGPGKGLYVLAGPSNATGLPPDLSTYVYSGDPLYPIVKTTRAEPDFDYVTIAIRPA